MKAFANGDGFGCFGTGFEHLQTQVRAPRMAAPPLAFWQRVTDLQFDGGPWGRGYLRAEQDITPDDWFFEGHFKDDPCMPGTMMFEACLQAAAFYLTSLGYTVDKDGWLFEPVPDMPYDLRCRGQVIPSSRHLVYEVFVEEVHDGPWPTVYADFLCTIDGLKAFHARRVGVRLRPDWPLTSRPELLRDYVEPEPVAVVDGFEFGYASLLACAWGKPSDAFGPMYRRFDEGLHCARLPGPPYHFMSRVTKIDGPIGKMKVGTTIELSYDIPHDEWYFDENAHRTMPFCVLLEAALQPCGWLASYVGSVLTVDDSLYFRNLDGSATWECRVPAGQRHVAHRGEDHQHLAIGRHDHRVVRGPVLPRRHADLRHEHSVRVLPGGCIGQPDRHRAQRGGDRGARRTERFPGGPHGATRQVLRWSAAITRAHAAHARPGDRLLADRRQGRPRAPAIREGRGPSEWFFKAHFFSDPVQPGSLGLEAMLQLMQFYMIERDLHAGMSTPRFEPLMLEHEITWKYRGQVTPRNRLIRCEVEITEVGRDDRGPYVIADAYLWVDELRIYQGVSFGMRVVEGGDPDASQVMLDDPEETLDPAGDAWLADHCPTYVIPALPAMSMLDRFAAAAQRASQSTVVRVRDMQVFGWVKVEKPVQIRTEVVAREGAQHDVVLEVWRDKPDPRLSRFEMAARGYVDVASEYPAPPPAWPVPSDALVVDDPYASGALFHGPAFHYVTELRLGPSGSVATLDVSAGRVPVGTLHQGLLDGLLHAVPHDDLHRWDHTIGRDQAAYPHHIQALRLFGPAPTDGQIRVVAQYGGRVPGPRGHSLPCVRLQAVELTSGRVWAELELLEVLLPKGRLGMATRRDRVAFLRDRQPVHGLALSTAEGSITRIKSSAIRASDWLPGTVAAVYGADATPLTTQVAVGDHVGRIAQVHPSTVSLVEGAPGHGAVSAAQPLTRWPLKVAVSGESVTVKNAGEPMLHLDPIVEHWDNFFGLGRWPVEDVYYSLIRRFVRRAHVVDPAAHEAIQGVACSTWPITRSAWSPFGSASWRVA